MHFSTDEARRIKKLMTRRKLSMVTPARATTDAITDYFGADVVREPYWIDLPESHHAERSPRDFETLTIRPSRLIRRRPQRPALDSLCLRRVPREPSSRPSRTAIATSRINFVGLEEGYLSRQVRQHQQILGDRLICHPKVKRDRCLEIIRAAMSRSATR